MNTLKLKHKGLKVPKIRLSYKLLLLVILTILVTITHMHAQEIEKRKNSLVVYYSRKGSNYLNGKIVNLKTGNTEVVAKKIQALTGSDIFRIETLNQYPSDFNETTDIAQKEKNENIRPELTAKINNIDDYDIIYLGYPIWWDTMPMALFTFLESYDFRGKTIIPFCTHEGSALGSSVSDVKKLCPEANVLQGLASYP